MKNRYLRAAVWMLTVLMVLGCLPLLAAAEGTLTEVSGGTSALNAGIMPLATGDGDAGISTVYDWGTRTWTIPFHIYAYDSNGNLSRITSGAITEQTGALSWGNSDTVPVRVNNHQDDIADVLKNSEAMKDRQNYEYISTSFGTSIASATPVSQIILNHLGGGAFRPTVTYGTNTVSTNDLTNYALFVFIKWVSITATIDGNGVATIVDEYGPTVITADDGLTSLKVTLPSASQVRSSVTGMTVAGWKDSAGNTYPNTEDGTPVTVTINKSTTFVPYLEATEETALHTVTFVQSSDHQGAGQKTSIYVSDGSNFSFPTLYSGWEVEGKAFVGWSLDVSGLTTSGYMATFPANTQWTVGGNAVVVNDALLTTLRNDYGYAKDNLVFYAIWVDEDYEATFKAYYHIRYDGVESTAAYYSPDANTGDTAFTPMDDMIGYIKTPVAIGADREAAAVNVSPPSRSTIYDIVRANASKFNPNLYTWANSFNYTNADDFFSENRVVWYTIKMNKHTGQPEDSYFGEAEEHWHVHGIIVPIGNLMLSYDPNGGAGGPENTQHPANGTAIPLNFTDLPTRAGYKFLGWSTNRNAVTPEYTAEGTTEIRYDVHKNEDVTVYAIWEALDGIEYIVKHYFEVPTGTDGYQIYEIPQKGKQDAIVSATSIAVDGFAWDSSHAGTKMTGTVTADNPETEADETLVLKLYYTRNLSTLKLTKSTDDTKATNFSFEISGIKAYQDALRTVSVNGTSVQIPNASGDVTEDATVSITVTVPKNGTTTIENMPTGTYTIWELDGSGNRIADGTTAMIGGRTYEVTGSGEDVTVIKGADATKTINNKLSQDSISVIKNWDDNRNAYGIRPAQITVKLMNGNTTAKTMTVDAEKTAESQTITFNNVEIYDDSDNAIAYTVVEDPVAGYETTIEGTTITNALKKTDVTISKLVGGNFGDPNKTFDFTASVTLNGKQYGELLSGDGYTSNGGTVTFALKGGQSVTIKDVPALAKVAVSEDPAGYTPSYMLGQDKVEGQSSVTLDVSQSQIAVTFINSYSVDLDTGVDLDTIPYVVMLLSIFGAGALWLIGRRRRTQN